ncbi:MAG: hypothetical protein JSV88_26180 [Candidatus Aminicenantes bacterium]|nr:MAG: hypothetical protein JSV88_26180 [Candidatus Aminicenantes bacterium]
MYKKHSAISVLFPLLVIGFLGPVSILVCQDLDRTDPLAVANYALMLVRVGDVDGMLGIMDKDQKKAYVPFTPDKREEMQNAVKEYSEKIGKVTQVSEIRELTTLSGKPGVAAKIGKKSGEVVVIVLSKEDNIYYYDDFLTLTSKAYKQLKLIKKAK